MDDIVNIVQGSVPIDVKVLALGDVFVSIREPLKAFTSEVTHDPVNCQGN